MTHTEPQLWLTLPIVRWEPIIYHHDEFGWLLVERHAHAGGTISDCGSARYGWMTAAELLDVLDAVLDPTPHHLMPPMRPEH